MLVKKEVTFRQHSYYNRLFERIFDLQEYSLIFSAGEDVFVANMPAAEELFKHLQESGRKNVKRVDSEDSSQRASLLDELLKE